MAVNNPRIALIPLARVHFDTQLAEEIVKKFSTQLAYQSLRVVGSTDLIVDSEGAEAKVNEIREQDVDLLLVLCSTFADSRMLSILIDEFDLPIFLWGFPEEPGGGRLHLGSLIGINLATHTLKLHGRRYQFAYADMTDRAAMAKLKATAAAAAVVRRLRAANIGLFGGQPAGMDTCYLDEPALRDRLGVKVHQLDIGDLITLAQTVPVERTEQLYQRISKKIGQLEDVDREATNRTLALYDVMRKSCREEALDAVAVRCWPEVFSDLKCSACGALSLLNDERIPTACEADVNGAISQLILSWLSGGTTFSTDLVSIHPDADGLVIWHCGQAPLSMADPDSQPIATVHSNRNLPLLVEFPLRPGPVTVCRLSRHDGDYRLVVARATMVRQPLPFSGTSGVLKMERPVREVIDTILSEGLEHHVSLTYGDHLDSLLSLADMLNLPVLRL